MEKQTAIRVGHVCSYFDDMFYREFMAAQQRAGLDVRVFYFAQKGRAPLPDGDCPYLRQAMCYGPLDRLSYFGKQEKAFRAFMEAFPGLPFDVLHAHSLFSNGYVAWRVKRKTGLPYVTAVRSGDIKAFFGRMPLLRPLGLRILREAARVVFLSENHRREVLEKYVPERDRAALEAKTLVIPNGIAALFLEDPGAPRAWDGRDRKVRLLTVGLVNPRKNQLAVCRAAEELQKRGYAVEYRVIGRRADEDYARRAADCPCAALLPPMPQAALIGEYRRADVYAMPSVRETFGLAYAEAMSQGLPVLYTRGQGFDGQTPEGAAGYAVAADDAQSLADAVERVLRERERLSAGALAQAARFDWEAIARIYAQIYREALS